MTLPPSASGTREVALVVWEREGEGDWSAYSGSCCLTTRKEQGEEAGMEPQAQAGQPSRGWAGAVRPGTLIAFGAWERPQGLGAGGRLTIQAPEWPLPPQGQGVQSWDALGCYRDVGKGDSRARTPACRSPSREGW